jgi:hypothetical protein
MDLDYHFNKESPNGEIHLQEENWSSLFVASLIKGKDG